MCIFTVFSSHTCLTQGSSQSVPSKQSGHIIFVILINSSSYVILTSHKPLQVVTSGDTDTMILNLSLQILKSIIMEERLWNTTSLWKQIKVPEATMSWYYTRRHFFPLKTLKIIIIIQILYKSWITVDLFILQKHNYPAQLLHFYTIYVSHD